MQVTAVAPPILKSKPKKPVFIRTSERTLWNICRLAWWWSYHERREMITGKSVALIFGDLVHRSLAEFYIPETAKKRKRGPHPAATYLKLYDAMHRSMNIKVRDSDEEKWESARDLGEEMMTNYIDLYGKDLEILVLYPEMPFQFDIYDPATGLYLCTYVGTTDAFIRKMSSGQYGLLEHKTAAAINTNHLFLDEQASTYNAIIPLWLHEQGILKPDQNIEFMRYNFLRKAGKDTRPKNALGQSLNKPTVATMKEKCIEIGYTPEDLKGCIGEDFENLLKVKRINPALLGPVSERQSAKLFHREDVFRGETERVMTRERIVQQVREMNMVRVGDLPHYKSPGKDCGFCQWRDVCELHETGSDFEELKKMVTRRTDPYELHVWALDVA